MNVIFFQEAYDYNEVIRIFNDIPKFELFRTSEENLLLMVDFIMSITNINHIQCFKLKPDKKRLSLYFVIPYYFLILKLLILFVTPFASNSITLIMKYYQLQHLKNVDFICIFTLHEDDNLT